MCEIALLCRVYGARLTLDCTTWYHTGQEKMWDCTTWYKQARIKCEIALLGTKQYSINVRLHNLVPNSTINREIAILSTIRGKLKNIFENYRRGTKPYDAWCRYHDKCVSAEIPKLVMKQAEIRNWGDYWLPKWQDSG